MSLKIVKKIKYFQSDHNTGTLNFGIYLKFNFAKIKSVDLIK